MNSHNYKSTACQHAQHAECRKCCKWCEAPCQCDCHQTGSPFARWWAWLTAMRTTA